MKQNKKKDVPVYSAEFKLAAVQGVLAGEGVTAVADDLGLRRKRLYIWKDHYSQLGLAGLARTRGGRPKDDSHRRPSGAEPLAGRGESLAARRKITELERKVGQQELELDCFGEALRRIGIDTKQKSTR